MPAGDGVRSSSRPQARERLRRSGLLLGRRPRPELAEYKAGPNRFELRLRTPKGVAGPQTITLRVYDGAVLINEESIAIMMT